MDKDDPVVKTRINVPVDFSWLKYVPGAAEDPDLRELMTMENFSRIGPAFYGEKNRRPLTFADVGPAWQKENPVADFVRTNIPSEEAKEKVIKIWGSSFCRVMYCNYTGPLLPSYEDFQEKRLRYDTIKEAITDWEAKHGEGTPGRKR